MSSTEILTAAVAVASALGSVCAVIFAVRKSNTEIDAHNIQSFKTRVGLLEAEKEDVKKRLTTCEGLHRENLSKQGQMQGIIQTLERVLQDRNPETVKFMEYLTKVASNSEQYMAQASKRDDELLSSLKAIGGFMEKVTEHFNSSHPIK